MSIEHKITEIRWHGRGGQGAKTAALLFAEIIIQTGEYYIQAFPEYGPERMGAPVQAFNRVSKNIITIHSNIINPDYVVVLDSSLLESNQVTSGLKCTSKIIINTALSSYAVSMKIHFNKDNIYVVNASNISIETVGKNIPNAPMLGALIKIVGNIDLNMSLNSVKNKLLDKFRNKPEVVNGNLNAISRAFQEVKNN
ncbi:MAG: 2-oxoacid:acceptor oxidoreductase family protein [Endomicrobium sp.]|jgi:pyruvate ferredoxin oxidoreductase gamma subunit|nr:2-oxoacid:acceptor oxidoreductase family protein [Endomicrobium sp.]